MKKSNIKNASVITITLIVILFACKKTNGDRIIDGPPVSASIAGLVTDTNNVAITNATVTAGGSVTTADANGRFTISNAQLNKDAGSVTISKNGYFTGTRTFLPNSSSVNNVKIQLIPKTVAGNFDAGTGGAVNILGGGKVDFGSGSVINASTNASYSGNVTASALFLNPTDSNFKKYMPRDLQGVDAGNNSGILHSYGMAVVELDDASGNKLQLAQGKTATITLPIASSLQANAPATVPLWFFDDTKGVWKQEGTAVKQGSNYVGTVKHFSFWSAGQLQQGIKMTVTLKDAAGRALINKLVWILSFTNANVATSVYTDNTGTLSAFVPANETLVLYPFDDCGNTAHKQSVGPFNTDTNLGIITTDYGGNGVNIISLSGTAADCNNAPIARGSVTAKYYAGPGVQQFTSKISNGTFSISFNVCKDLPVLVPVYVYDSATSLASNEYFITITSSNQNIGQIQVCNSNPTVAGFTYSVGNTALPVPVTFNNTSTNATSWLWNFGDGTSSSAQNPTHSYTASGDFTVSLTATGPAGSNTFSTVVHIPGTVDDSHINLTVNGTNYSWAAADSLSAYRLDSVNKTLIRAGGSSRIQFYILNDNTAPGNYNITLSAVLNGISYPDNNATTTVTEYGIPGGYIIGTASGQMKQQDSTSSRAFSMSYKVKRNQ